jgi:folate-binding protein YgfZ
MTEHDIITDLSHYGLIKVSGDDAEKFLQGQFTNDVCQVTDKHSQLSAWCSSKGRIIVNFRLFKRDNAYYMLLPRESIATTLKRLQMYVLRAAVKLEEQSDNLLRLGIAGANSTQILTDCLGFAPPAEIDASLTLEQITVLQIPGTQPRYIVCTENPQNLWQCATQTAHPAGATAWELLDILAGLPQIIPATAEAFVPQMVNYQALGGVNFKKGCYTGQEIVARLQYLGTLKRRMYLAKMTTLPQPGDALYVSTNEQSIGKIVNAVADPDGGAIVLAVIQISSADSDEIHWQSQQGECLQFMDLPYKV